MAGPNTLHPADQWCNFITRPTNGVTSSLTQSDIHVCRAGPAVAVQTKKQNRISSASGITPDEMSRCSQFLATCQIVVYTTSSQVAQV
uniref:Uncharacterized protein n=1 Tax=Anguilla anguilla TaxID=7936 RepID=A0A0E9X8L6_ANGAN